MPFLYPGPWHVRGQLLPDLQQEGVRSLARSYQPRWVTLNLKGTLNVNLKKNEKISVNHIYDQIDIQCPCNVYLNSIFKIKQPCRCRPCWRCDSIFIVSQVGNVHCIFYVIQSGRPQHLREREQADAQDHVPLVRDTEHQVWELCLPSSHALIPLIHQQRAILA